MTVDVVRRRAQAACITVLALALPVAPSPTRAADAATAPPSTAAEPKQEEKEELTTELWALTYFLSSRLETDASKPSRSTRVDDLVKTLNELYGKDKPVVFLVGGGNLLLRGTSTQLLEVKRILAVVDSPWPQVQMTFWALQVSGSPQRIAVQLEGLAADVRATREAIVAVQRRLVQSVRPAGPADIQPCARAIYGKILCGKSPVFIPKSSPLSLNESLILLTLHARRQAIVSDLRDWVSLHFKNDVERAGVGLGNGYQPLRRLELALDSLGAEPDCEAFGNFVTALEAYDGKSEGAPEALARTGTILDRVLKDVVDAYAADLSELFLDPLLKRAQLGYDGPKAPRGDGVVMTGRSRIVVTSGLKARLAPELSSSVEISRPKAFTDDLLNRAFPAKKEGDPSLTGANRVLEGLPQAEAIILAAALAEPEAHFAKVAPGVEVNVRPTVLPDGAAARLTIDASFGVTTTPIDAAASTDTRNEPPPPAVETHHVQTDATVGVFDLFDISSFSITTSHPQSPAFFPVLGRLPIIGRAFQWPRRPKQTHHESVILINTVVLPRALTLSSFYRPAPFEKAIAAANPLCVANGAGGP
jgi:hypothetical protein